VTNSAPNPKTSPITRGYLDAQAVIGGLPDTPRERALFDALQDALAKNYEADQEEKEDIAALREELANAERSEKEEHDRADEADRKADELREEIDELRDKKLGCIDDLVDQRRDIRLLLDRIDRLQYEPYEALKEAKHLLRDVSQTMSTVVAEFRGAK
jgi:uncharacterized coiled-coil DUF342 family protein